MTTSVGRPLIAAALWALVWLAIGAAAQDGTAPARPAAPDADSVTPAPAERRRVTEHTYVFARNQNQYNLYMNYLNNHHVRPYIDRPLLYNRNDWDDSANDAVE